MIDIPIPKRQKDVEIPHRKTSLKFIDNPSASSDLVVDLPLSGLMEKTKASTKPDIESPAPPPQIGPKCKADFSIPGFM